MVHKIIEATLGCPGDQIVGSFNIKADITRKMEVKIKKAFGEYEKKVKKIIGEK